MTLRETLPDKPKIYHIVHVDKLQSIIQDGHLWCDREAIRRKSPGTSIGIANIKERRLKNPVKCHPGLLVGDCVPFYWGPRSVMLYMLHMGNLVDYKGGQVPLVHLVCDLAQTVSWAQQEQRRWAFTFSNAGSGYFEDSADLARLSEIDWNAVGATYWQECRERKQAEFLMEFSFPWHLVERVGVISDAMYSQTINLLPDDGHRPLVEVHRDWYY